MANVASAREAGRIEWRDWWALGKPRLSALVLATGAVGLRIAPTPVSTGKALLVLLATAAVVAAANALNSYLERDIDRAMQRTRSRPLPSGRIEPLAALVFSLTLATLATGILYRFANPLTALLAFVAFASYAWVYTPMKQVSWLAVWVGAIPGAIPPLMGYTAATGHVGRGGLAVFFLMFFWQLPHFFAIALYLAEDYNRGGLKVLPIVHGQQTTLWAILLSSIALLPVAILPTYWHIAPVGYAALAFAASTVLVIYAARGFWVDKARLGRFGRQFFLATILHLSVLLVALTWWVGATP